MESASNVSTTTVQHYNDWPNAPGFDTTYEEHEPVELNVQGKIPAYAAGTLFRTATGPRSVKKEEGQVIFKTNHWFDAFSQVHRFQLHKPANASDPDAVIGKVTYNSRLTSDALISRIQQTGKPDDFTFAAKYEPCKSFFSKVQAVFKKAPELAPNECSNAVTMSINFPALSKDGNAHPSSHDPSRTATLCNKTDTSRLQFLDPETLKPTGLSSQSRLHPELKGVLSAAHPETDPVTGDIYSYNMDFSGRLATYRVFRTSAKTAETTILATINYPPAYLHSMFTTEHFLIICIWNSYFSKFGASILWTRNILDAIYFNKTAPATWFVIDRRCPTTEGGRGVVTKFESDPFFAFHTVNAYEEPKKSENTASDRAQTVDLVCDLTTYVNTDVLHYFYMDNLVSSNPAAHEKASQTREGRYEHIKGRLQRFRLPNVTIPDATTTSSRRSSATASTTTPRKATIEFTVPPSETMELPTIHPSCATKPYRYIYGIQGHDGTKSTFVDGLVKYDLQSMKATKWSVAGQTPGEAIFIPKPDGEHEDDGVLLTVVLDGYTGKSYLLCLDARDLGEVGRVSVDGPVGFGFHGLWTRNL